MDDNLSFIRKGKTGCVFATILSKDPDKIGWIRVFNPLKLEIPQDAFIVSLIFQGWDKNSVKEWALKNGMFEEATSANSTGLRYRGENGLSWVQYFGPDSHSLTRQSPHPELLFCVKLPIKYYHKVGFRGILHLAHASVEYIKENYIDTLWDKSFVRTESILGHKPTILEAAKTTFKK